jgi:hypothetical protein
VAVSSDVTIPIPHSRRRFGFCDVNVRYRISSLLKKPARKGKPTIASAPIRNVQ